MRRRSDRRVTRIAIPLAAAASLAAASNVRADDPRGFGELDAMLTSLGETGLRVDLAIAALESPVRSDTDSRRARFESLARPIERWLSEPVSAEERLKRLERASRLAELAERDEAESLRWPLATGRYLAAASAVDLLRSGGASAIGQAALVERVAACAEAFDLLERESSLERSRLASRLLRTSGVETDLVAEEQRRLEAEAVRARFLAGWSQVQRALLASEPTEARLAARQAQARLLPLLDAGSEEPRPSEVSIDRRGDPGFAQTILGAALARGTIEGAAEGRAWLDLLSHPSVDREIVAARPAWELLMLAAADDAEALREMLERGSRAPGSEGPLRPEWIRMATVAAWPRAGRSPRWAAALDAALASSASRGDVAGIGELMSRLAEVAPPASPLAVAWNEAWTARESAIARGDASAWAQAADRLLQTANLLAARGEGGEGGARRLERLAVEALLEADAPAEAIAVLARSEDDSPESAWLGIVALDRLRSVGTSEEREESQRRWNEAGRRFLETHPDHPRASLVAVRLGGDRMDLAALEAFASTRDPQLSREARSAIAERLALADRGERLGLALALRRLGPIAIERGGPEVAKDPAARREAMGLLEATLVVEDPDPVRAAQLLDRLDPKALAVRGVDSTPRERDAWNLHRAELAWLEGDAAAAQSFRDAAINEARNRGDSAWASAAARRWLARVAATWSAEQSDAASSELLWRAAMDVLELAADSDPVVPAASLEAMRAAAARWRISGDDGHARSWRGAAWRAAEDAPCVEASISLAEASLVLGDAAAAIKSARTALTQCSRGEPAWRRAKRLQIEALAEIDPLEARAVLDQLRVLDPDWRQGADGESLAAIDAKLPPAASREATP